MEKHPQADPSQKSPVSKVLPPAPPEDTNQPKPNGMTNGSSLDKKLESSPTLASKTYQETKSEASADAKPLESAGVSSKNGQISDSSAEADKSLPHPIISVDIQKSMPYENKQVVPEEPTKSEADVKPEVVASVVTTAVVKEAALAVSETESSVVNGSKVSSDSSKVDAIVEQELAKISDSASENTELKATVLSDEEPKPLLNGDIDHSPVNETITSDSSNNDKRSKDGGVKTSTNQETGKDNETANSDVSSCNGVPGIITVETITKKDSSSTPEKNLQTEFAKCVPKESVTKDSKDSPDSKDSAKSGDSKEEQKCEKLEKNDEDSKISHESTPEKNLQTEFAKCVPKESVTKDSKDSPDSKDSAKSGDSKEEQKCEKLEKSVDDSKISHESTTEKSGVPEFDKNLTDSAKLLKETTESGGKMQSEVDSHEISKTPSTETSDLSKTDTKIETIKLEEESPAKLKTSEPVKDATNMAAVTEENVRVCDKTENLESQVPESESKKLESEESSSKPQTLSETEKKDVKNPGTIASETKKDNSETPSKDVKCVSDEKTECQSSDTVADDKTKPESSPSRKESPNLQSSRVDQENTNGVETNEISKTEETTEVEYDMTAMMTSQILTPEMLNGGEDSEQIKDTSTSDSKDDKFSSKTDFEGSTKVEDDSRISASRRTPETCDVGVGLDERKMARVAAGDGGEEEVDGQQATTEVEVTEESLASHPDEADSENLVPSGTHSPTSVSPTSDRSQSSTKASPTPPSKPSSAISQREDSKKEESKPASAVSRSSIPEPIIYEPPERRKSATSTSSDEKKDTEQDKTQKDEKEEDKSAENQKLEEEDAQESAEVPTEGTDEQKDDAKTDYVQICPEKEPSAEEKTKTTEEDETKEEEKITEKEKGAEDAKDKEDVSSKSGEKVDSKETATAELDDAVKSDAAEDGKSMETDERTDTPATNAEEEPPEKEEKEASESTQEADTDVAKESEIVAKPETESDDTVRAEEEKEKEIKDEDKTEEDVSEVKTVEVKEEKEEDVKDNEDDKSKLESEAQKLTDEPTTLVEEDSKAESSEKEATGPEEKEEDEAEAKKEDKGDAEEGEIVREDETQKEAENEAIEETETVKIEEQEENESGETEEKAVVDAEAATEDEPKEEEKEEEGKEVEKEETEDEPAEGNVPEPTDEPEKHDVEKEEEPEEKPESPPKSPTKRMRSPDKSGRRGSLPQLRLIPKGSGGWGTKSLLQVGRISPFEGVSPISSPPKPLKTPPSPQKPQKSTSPKKKNGMLSPIKTPKTPGSDGRKLPPIKAPVGLAPNPNLKNIRSKIGSFDNIRYKPGGGDKKVISSKKLEWKAAPKIGSLDHSLKGEKKQAKSFSKGESKEGKLVDGQSPLPSGDEGEQDGAAAATESVIKTESGPSTEMPAAIAAES